MLVLRQQPSEEASLEAGLVSPTLRGAMSSLFHPNPLSPQTKSWDSCPGFEGGRDPGILGF